MSGRQRLSAVLDDDTLQEISYVFAAIGGGFQEVEDLLPLDHDDRVALLVEERDDRVLVHAIGLAFQLIDTRRQFDDPFTFLERAKRLGDAVGRVADDFGQTPRAWPDPRNLVEA